MAEHNAEISAIAGDQAPATFDNTVGALERAGDAMNRTGGVFWNYTGTESTPELQAIERELAPKIAAHYAAIGLDEHLFRRVEAVWKQRDALPLTPEQKRLLELTYDGFVRSGALLDAAQKERYAEISTRLATLGAQFAQNVLADEAEWLMLLESGDLDGLPQSLRESAARMAADRGHPGKWAITLARSSVEPFLTYSARRDLREKAFSAWIARGENSGKTDNRPIAAEIVRLRDESARMLGYETYAHYKLADQMAKTPERVRALIESVWRPAKIAAAKERDVLQELAAKEGGNFAIAPHDWRYYAEKARKSLHNIDEADVRPYLALDAVIGAAFDVAHKLFGVTFHERRDLELYNPEARAWDVQDENGQHVALFIGDYFARPTKRGGAWMSIFRAQSEMDGKNIRPIVVNVMNFAKGAEGKPALIGLDDARTLFHEFGHGLHGMLTKVTFPSISGTNVVRDFVEFPSQVYEHWLLEPQVLAGFARHAETGEPIPQTLVDRIRASQKFNIGFGTVEFCSSALVDLDLHLTHPGPDLDVVAFEREELKKIGMPKEIVMRHRTPHFGHVFSGPGYAAGYYSYLWSSVLDTDGFAAFKEAGDIFDPATARRLKDYVYAAGGREAPEDAYRHFRGRDPDSKALLEERGFA
ncbi:MAG: M3 family metallopeptidase [Hyphomicrobiales bacterium]|nr:M3 family metallopeptidase [Hyphomicrobiales bacterium]